jgi:hypothetical protein
MSKRIRSSKAIKIILLLKNFIYNTRRNISLLNNLLKNAVKKTLKNVQINHKWTILLFPTCTNLETNGVVV